MTQPPLEIGKTYLTPGRTVGEGDITLFAGLVGDFTPVHMDADYCSRTSFGSRIAHGPLTMATAIGLFTHVGVLGERVVALLNLNWDFSAPVRIGDTIRAEVTIEALRPTSKGGRHVCSLLFRVLNQTGAEIQRGTMKVLLQGL
ncbi:MaoC/PaaZ C-terminal domain-containing protein [Prosthecodimorpha staleyi]|uniref:MaoC family dehydratase N-terminal domain-containing protein n=1 Tax=Prosthecodimorpha staleyi TaxID=2840188 RepID=A0A947D9E7_9HYPH|nr:MaoC/PaaZ C-terminal domain-containing protein [Prosthecodimorpha staleyi]MBT9292898.1 MaoC family dehydratase N-terminal domain-containing protein [Prosthecodimorpha staleyi]